MAKLGDQEFMEWCQGFKECRWCKVKFYGPVCECEMKLWTKK